MRTRDAERLRLVTTAAVDGTGPVRLSVSSEAISEELPGLQLSEEGDSLASAAEELRLSAGAEELYFAHVRFLLCSADTAGAGPEPLFDYCERNSQMRLTVPFFLVRGEAGDLIRRTGEGSEEITALLTSLTASSRREGREDATLLQTIRTLSLRGSALVSVLRVRDSGQAMPSAEEGLLLPERDGYAVLSETAGPFFLPEEAALGAELLTENIGSRELTLPSGEAVKLTGTRSEARFSENGALTLTVELNAALAGRGESAVPREQTEAELAALVRDTAEAALRTVRERSADFPGLYRAFRRQYPKSSLSREEFLSDLTWVVNAQAHIVASYDTR